MLSLINCDSIGIKESLSLALLDFAAESGSELGEGAFIFLTTFVECEIELGGVSLGDCLETESYKDRANTETEAG